MKMDHIRMTIEWMLETEFLPINDDKEEEEEEERHEQQNSNPVHEQRHKHLLMKKKKKTLKNMLIPLFCFLFFSLNLMQSFLHAFDPID